MPIPVYAFTGFLESGKTLFIQQTLEDPRFNAGERTLLLVCEEGEEEYDASSYPHKCVYFEPIDQQTVTTEALEALQKKHHAQRVVVELNGMLPTADFFNKMPMEWVVAQEVMFADSRTILSYNANMRQLVVDKLSGAEMVVFNRVKPGEDIMPLHKLARALKAGGRIYVLDMMTDETRTVPKFSALFAVNMALTAENGWVFSDSELKGWMRDAGFEPAETRAAPPPMPHWLVSGVKA